MRFEKIEICNFKGLREVEFLPRSFSCIVGENNAGKSSVLQAIVYALNRPTELPESMFYDRSQPVTFKCEFSGVSEDQLRRLADEHRTKISALVENEIFRVLVRYPFGEKVEIRVIKNIPNEDRYKDENINELFKGKRGTGIQEVMAESYPEWSDEFPGGLNLTDSKSFVRDRIALLPPESFSLGEVPLPSGISSSITNLLPEPIYIPAVKNINDDLKTTQSTSFGRLLGLLLEDMSEDFHNYTEALYNIKRLLNRHEVDGVEVDERHQKVRELEGLVENFLGENFPQVRVVLEIPPPELKTILNSAKIYVDDGSLDLIDHKGDGIKRSLTFALLRTYVHQNEERRERLGVEEDLTRRPLFFLFEEPELYLHPRAQKVLFNTLESISGSHQLVLTTHSPLFFAPGVTANFVRISKDSGEPKPVGVLHPVDFELEPTQIEAFKLARFENADAGFFCSKVVLFEGESDDFFMRHVAKTLNEDYDFEKENIALIKVGGKGNFSRFRDFFERFGIEVIIIADLDAIFDGFQHLGAPQPCQAVRENCLREIDRRIQELGIRPEITARRVKKKINQPTWKDRYQQARAAVRKFQETQEISKDELSHIDALFTWEEVDARLKAVIEDNVSTQAINPLVDILRENGISVLSKGALEDYYPEGAPQSGPKPERALRAIEIVSSRESAQRLSTSLAEGRPTELEEVFSMVFNS